MLGSGEPVAPWVDVTKEIDAACSTLSKGQMVHCETFSLFDAMSAIEIGCPKMDIGFTTGTELTAEDRIDNGEAPLNLDLQQVVAITDRLLAGMASYFRGDPLAQTVYTCLYVMRPERNASVPTLHTIVQLVAAVCKLVTRIGETSGVLMEDEISLRDAVPGGPTTPTTQQALHRAKQVETDLRTMTRPRGGSKKDAKDKPQDPSAPSPSTAPNGDAAASKPPPTDGQLAAALLKRLEFLRALLQGLELYEPGKKSGLASATEHFRSAAQLIRDVADTAGVAEGVAAPGFCEEIVPKRHLAMPRHVTVMGVPEGYKTLQKLAEDLAWSSAQLAKCSSWEGLRDLLFAFARRATGPVARSLLYNALAKKDRLKTELASEAPWVITRGQVAREFGLTEGDVHEQHPMMPFLVQAENILQTWQQLMCLERSRQHRKVRRYLEDWTVLYRAAEEAAAQPEVAKLLEKKGWKLEHPEIRQGTHPLTLMVEHMTARVQVDNLLAGFDLDLYQPREYLMLFWYLDYLLAFCNDCVKAWQLLHPQGGLRGQKRDPARVLRYLRQAVPLEVMKFVCQGYTRTIAAMAQEGRMKERSFPFNTSSETFDQRFCHFHFNPAPQPLWYEDFKSTTNTDGVPAARLYQMAYDSFSQAARVCETFRQQQGSNVAPEELEELGSLIRVAAQNATATSLLVRTAPTSTTAVAAAAAQGDGGPSANGGPKFALSVSWEFTQHPQFPVIGLRSASAAAAAPAPAAAAAAVAEKESEPEPRQRPKRL